MHGMAGSAALILLTLNQVDTPWQGLVYILLFGVGSVIGMAILSLIIIIPFRVTAKRVTWLYNGLQGITGAMTLALGGMVCWQIAG